MQGFLVPLENDKFSLVKARIYNGDD